MATPSDIFSILNKNPDVEKEKFKDKKVNTNIYRRGKAPVMKDEEEDKYASKKIPQTKKESEPKKTMITEFSTNSKSHVEESSIKVDRRLQRLSQFTGEKGKEVDDKVNERMKMRREIFKSEFVSSDDKEIKEKKDKAENEGRREKEEISAKIKIQEKEKDQTQSQPILDKFEQRQRMKERLLEQAKKQESDDEFEFASASEKKSEAEDEEGEESEDEGKDTQLLRPVFINKEDRQTIKDQYEQEQAELEYKEMEKKYKEEKKKQTKKLVLEYIAKDLEEKTKGDSEDEDMPDDTDYSDNLAEYENWKIRELKRIMRQVEEQESKVSEKKELERRRGLNDNEIEQENQTLGSDATIRPFKSKYVFMQKYYHSGVFFTNEAQGKMDHVLNRNYNLPTSEDKFDKSKLVGSKQKRRGQYGMKGQSKYTHLSKEDTTEFDPIYKVPENIAKKIQGAQGGFKNNNLYTASTKKK